MARSILAILLASILVMVTLSGCASWAATQEKTLELHYPHAKGETLALTSEEHYHRVSRVSSQNARALVDDLDLWFLSDRPTRLTRWHNK